jgi:hypothetical protein
LQFITFISDTGNGFKLVDSYRSNDALVLQLCFNQTIEQEPLYVRITERFQQYLKSKYVSSIVKNHLPVKKKIIIIQLKTKPKKKQSYLQQRLHVTNNE